MEDGVIWRMIDETRTLDLKLEFFPFTAMDIIHTYVSKNLVVWTKNHDGAG